MNSIHITLPDGHSQSFPKGIKGIEIARTISEGLARNALAIEVNEDLWDLDRPIENEASIKICTWKDEEGKYAYWHSSAHLMAEALESLYPGIKLGIGPPIKDGFYYDIDFGEYSFGEEDLVAVEEKMKTLTKTSQPYTRKAVSKKEALSYFNKKENPYKIELINNLDDKTITFYTQGNFTDLCRGPHIPSTKLIKAIKLLNIAGAYWRGNEKNKMLTRIYGITFPKQKELEEYLILLEEAKKRDHRKIGKEMELFSFSQHVGIGLPLWLPKGTIVRDQLELFMRRTQVRHGYNPVITPHIGSKSLYTISGHYDKYGKDSFLPIHTPDENEEFLLKPMNCPHHCEIYKAKPRSYKELPIRLCEFGTVYRYEQSGELHGLTRVRGFTQDDAHIFCRPDQVKDEFIHVIDLVLYVFKSLGFSNYTAQISLRDPNNKEKYIGRDELWERAEQEIQDAARERNLEAVTVIGEAAFYGPKLDFMIQDALKRSWQLGTIQVDYNLPERFSLEYVSTGNQKHRPVMIHRAPFGSLERFIAVLIEHCAGNFPPWLAPIQVAILPISDRFNDYIEQTKKMLDQKEIRSTVDDRSEKIQRKIRDAEINKIPFMFIIGEKEASQNTISLRIHGQNHIGSRTLDQFFDQYGHSFNLPT